MLQIAWLRHGARLAAVAGALTVGLGAALAADAPAPAHTAEATVAPAQAPSEDDIDYSLLLSEPSTGAGPARLSRFRAEVPTGWDTKIGLDHRQVGSSLSSLRPDPWASSRSPEETTGVAWAQVTAPGLQLPWSWDQTLIDTRIDPQQEGRLGMTLSRSLPLSDNLAVTFQNGYAVTQTFGHEGAESSSAHSYESHQSLRFNILPAGTTLSLDAVASSTDARWLRSLSAEQKLFGPWRVTGSVSETGSGDFSKSVTAGFKRTW